MSLAEVLTSVDGIGTQLFLNTEELVVLGKTFRAAGSTGLDLASTETDDEISNGGVLSFTRAVGDHDTPTSSLGVLGGLDGFGQGTNLVNLEQQGVACLLLDGGSNALGVGDKQIIADELVVRGGFKQAPVVPVILVESILNRDDGVFLGEGLVQVGQLLTGQVGSGVRVGVLKVKVVFAILVEFRGGAVHADLNLAGVTSLLDGSDEQLETFLVVLDVGGETTFVTDVGGILTVLVLDDVLESVVDFRAHLHGLREGLGAGGQNHEFLHGKLVTSVGATVDDVESRDRKNEGLLGASQVSQVDVERNTLLASTSLGNSKGNTEDGVSTKLALVLGTIELDHEFVNGLLVSDGDVGLNQSRADNLVDVLDGLQDT